MFRPRNPAPTGGALLLVVLLTAATAGAQSGYGEFQVNRYTVGAQVFPAVGMDADGDFVVAWTSPGQDGSSDGVFARRFNAAGAALAVEFQVATFTLSRQQFPAVAMKADGGFVVAWQSYNQDGWRFGVFARRFDGSGVPQGAEFRVNNYTFGDQMNPAVTVDGQGRFVVTWQAMTEDGNSYGIFARRFDAAGGALSSAFQVNVYTTGAQTAPVVGADANGRFVVAWQSAGQDGSGSGVFARRFDAQGSALGGELRVNAFTPGAQVSPVVAMDGVGRFVVSWTSAAQDGSFDGVFARRFNSAGAFVGGDFQINVHTPNNQAHPALAIHPSGGFIAAWDSGGQDPSGLATFVRVFDAAGAGPELQVNDETWDHQGFPAVALAGDGRFVVAWQSFLQDGSSEGIFAQRYLATFSAGPAAALDVDGNGTADALTDGILVSRHLFGFTGTLLTGGALGGGCKRCTASAIEAYLATLNLDIDGNGSKSGLTDGLLVVRFLLGLRGAGLIANVVGVGCKRCTAASIEAYLQSMM